MGNPCRFVAGAVTLGFGLLAGCTTAPPPIAAQRSMAEVAPATPPAEAREHASDHFYRGKALALAGEPACAREEFQAALETFRAAAREGEGDDLDFAAQLYDSVSVYDRRAAGSENASAANAAEERPPAEKKSDSLVAQPPAARPDEIAAAQKEVASAPAVFDIPVVVNDRVLKAVAFYQFRTPRAFAAALQRSGRYMPLLRQILKEQGLPQDLVYVAMVESAFKSGAHSRASAHGFWQFIDGTGRRYGLKKTRDLEERSDVVKSTRAAAAYFRDLYEMFGDWALAMGAYDSGEGRILRALQATGAKDYWELSSGNALPRETRDYVPFVFAAALISKDPAKFGFDVVPDPPLAFEVAEIDRRIDLAAVARATGATLEEIQSLNSELRGRATPHGRYPLRVPPGRAEALLAAIPGLPAARDLPERKVLVRKGDTLARIARRHHVSVAELCEWNDLSRDAVPKRGTRLVLPTRGGTPRHAAAAVIASGEPAGAPRGEVRAIPTPAAAITSAAQIDVAETTPAAAPSTLPDRYDIPDQGFTREPPAVEPARSTAAPVKSRAKKLVYTVRPGDTLFHIAQAHGITVDAIRKTNRLSRRETIAAGRRLTLPVSR